MIDTSRIAKRSGIRNVVHTNGFINKEPLEKLCKFVDAFCVDLKGFTEEFYKKNTSANLKQVLESLQIIKGNGVWLELVNLVIPSQNDSLEKIKEMSLWIKKNLGKNVPLTFSRFYPTHKLTNLPPTPVSTLEKAREIAVKAGLNYVYIGNVPGHKYEDTYCPNCGDKIIDRYGYHIVSNKIIEGRCKFCGYEIKGVWNEK
jgi:pyruvate formate lyase activating enzyme